MFFDTHISRLLGLVFLALPLSPALAAGDSALETPVAAHLPDGIDYIHHQNTPHIRTVQQDANTLRAVIDWQSFNIGENAHVHFDQQAGSGSITVNRVTGGGTDPSKILGKLTANGTVVILDPNGVIFGAQAVIDVGGIIAATGQIANKDGFLDNESLHLHKMDDGRPDATVQNFSHHFTVRDAGLAAFVAPVVKNSGTITARLGHITLASGRKATLDFYGDRLVHMTAPLTQPLPPASAQIENTGNLIADGGRITLSARAAAGVVDKAINTTGILSAQKAGIKNGKIILSVADDTQEIRENSILIGNGAKVQNAVDIANTDGSTTIHLQAGIYTENLVVSKPVTLTGPVLGTAAIVSPTDHLPTVHVTAHNVTLSHLTFVGGMHNLLAEAADGLSLLSSRLIDSLADAVRLVNTTVYHFSGSTVFNPGGADIVHETMPGNSQGIIPPEESTPVPNHNRIFTNPVFGLFQKSAPGAPTPAPTQVMAEALAQIAPAAGDENSCDGNTTGCAE